MFEPLLHRVLRLRKTVGNDWSQWSKKRLLNAMRDVYWQLEGLEQAMVNTMLLFPDQSREQHEAREFCFAEPCTKSEWYKLMQSASTKHEFLPFAIKQSDKEEIAIILRDTHHTDDDCLTTAAWLRLVREFTGMIYALPFEPDAAFTRQPLANIIARTAGVPIHQVRHIEV